MKLALRIVSGAAALAALLTGQPTRADSVTVGVPAGPMRGNCFPYSCFIFAKENTYQQVYASNAFPSTPLVIQSFDLFASLKGLLDETVASVYFSTTQAPSDFLQFYYLNNIGSDYSLFEAFALGGVSESVLPFKADNPFFYDPSRGNLLMTTYISAGTAIADPYKYAYFDYDMTNSGVTSRLFGSGPILITDWTGSGQRYATGLVTRFNFQPVPEPLSFLGAASCFSHARRMRKRLKASRKPGTTGDLVSPHSAEGPAVTGCEASWATPGQLIAPEGTEKV